MIDAFHSIRNAYAFIFREPRSKPSYFERQQQIKVLLCYLRILYLFYIAKILLKQINDILCSHILCFGILFDTERYKHCFVLSFVFHYCSPFFDSFKYVSHSASSDSIQMNMRTTKI